MPKALGALLVALGFLLLALFVGIVGAAARESVLEPGAAPTRRRRWSARGAMAFTAILLVLLLFGGKHWWDAEAADYRNNRLYHPISVETRVRVENGQRVLRLEINDPKFVRSPPLVPDHGKLMHLFLVREPQFDAFAHLHPLKQNRKTFETALPDLPGGTYRLYADVTYETGLSDTLTNSVVIPQQSSASQLEISPARDPDDSWQLAPTLDADGANRESQLSPDYTMTWLGPRQGLVNQPLTLRFAVRASDGQPVTLEPYLGMRGHLALLRDDGAVFTHLHPGGSASMAAMQLATFRAEGKLPLSAAFGGDDPICQLPAMSPGEQEWLRGSSDSGLSGVSFPYAFPKPGRYRLWVQVKVNGKVLTGVFDIEVSNN